MCAASHPNRGFIFVFLSVRLRIQAQNCPSALSVKRLTAADLMPPRKGKLVTNLLLIATHNTFIAINRDELIECARTKALPGRVMGLGCSCRTKEYGLKTIFALLCRQENSFFSVKLALSIESKYKCLK